MCDLPDEGVFVSMVRKFIHEQLPPALTDLEHLLNRNRIFRDRTEGNFCLHFQFRTIHDDGTTEADKAKDQLNALFGEGPSKGKGPAPTIGSPSTEDEARSRLEDLFKK